MSTNQKSSGTFFSVIKGTGVALLFSLAAILVFAFIMRITDLDESVVKPVNQFIKVLAIFLGCYFSLSGTRGYIKGALVGISAIIVTFFVFSAIGGTLTFDVMLLYDLLLGLLVGALSGIIAVNLKK